MSNRHDVLNAIEARRFSDNVYVMFATFENDDFSASCDDLCCDYGGDALTPTHNDHCLFFFQLFPERGDRFSFIIWFVLQLRVPCDVIREKILKLFTLFDANIVTSNMFSR